MKGNNICIACGGVGINDAWNNLSVCQCPNCFLAWRTDFDLPADYYQTVTVDSSYEKKIKRERNTVDQINMVKKYLPKSHIWDLGAGDGTFLMSLKNQGYTECVGVEPGENGLKIARERNLIIERGMISDLPVLTKDKKVSAITMFHLIEHLSNPKESLSVIRKALPEKAVLVIETPNAKAPIQYITNHRNHLVYPEHLYYWTEQSLKAVLEREGFEIVAVKFRSFDWLHAPIMTSLLRLGLRTEISSGHTNESASKNSHRSLENMHDSPSGVFRKIARVALAMIVHVLRRDDYVMVIAKAV